MRFRELATGESTYATAIAAAANALALRGWTWSGELARTTLPDSGVKREAAILAYAPVARRNGFQAALYSRAWDCGIAPIPVYHFDELARLPWPGALICHFHWLGGITRTCTTLSEADAAVERFASLLDELKRQHRWIVWTLHNVLPHDTSWPEQDLRIRRLIVDAADVVHVMTSNSAEAAAESFSIPEQKLLHVPHPCYRGIYPDHQNLAEARFELGLRPDDCVFLSLGEVSPYKGYDQLMPAWDRLQQSHQGRRLNLIIAGKAPKTELRKRIAAWALGRSDVQFVPNSIPNDELQTYFRAADVSVCPYVRTLNSGAAVLSLTFGVPVIGPRKGAFADLLEGGAGILYIPDDPDGLYRAMAEYLARDFNALRSAAAARTRPLQSATVSDSFFSELRSRLNLMVAADGPTTNEKELSMAENARPALPSGSGPSGGGTE